MSDRLRKKLSFKSNHTPSLYNNSSYDIADPLWEDSAASKHSSPVADPSMNDFLKGYNMQTKSGEGMYEFKQFANTKKAAKETVDISYTPEALVKRILTLWRNNGPLQSFFDGFVSNQKVSNKLKKQLADMLGEMGYEVHPTFHDEKPRYANTVNSFFEKTSRYADDNVEKFLSAMQFVFPESKVIEKVAKEVGEVNKSKKVKVDKDSMQGLMDYYEKIFPSDFVKQLADKALSKPKKYFDEFKDFELSDESLKRMEQFNKGDQNFMSRKPNDGGMGGYNFPADMRGDGPGGVPPNAYESRVAKKKRF
jgi:hypothetical protein